MDADSTSTLSTFTASDGDNLAVQDWPLAPGVAMRGFVLLVHGLGEHAGRYEHVARRLNGWGFAVRGFDQYGHGESGGARGGLPTATRLLDDLHDMVDSTRSRTPDGKPLVLLGHSMGGLVAARYVMEHPKSVDALVLSSPALATHMTGIQKFLLRVVPQVAPNLRLSNGLDTRWLSHDSHVERAYKADPLVHDRISARLAQFIAEGGPAVVAHAARWPVPTLLMWAGSDRLVKPQGSRDFASAASPQQVSSREFAGLYHEIFNEREAEPVYECLRGWLDARF